MMPLRHGSTEKYSCSVFVKISGQKIVNKIIKACYIDKKALNKKGIKTSVLLCGCG
jgi:hypothetical protein